MAHSHTLVFRLLGFFAFCAILPTPATSAPVPKDGATPLVKWSIQSDSSANQMHDPLAVKDFVIVGNDQGQLCAFRNTDGKLIWRHEHGKRLFHPPSSDGERVFFTSDTRNSTARPPAMPSIILW